MRFTFARTKDSVGLILPQVIAEFHLGLTAASGLPCASTLGSASAALGFPTDRIGRMRTILPGPAWFAATADPFPAAHRFAAVLAPIF